MTATRFPEGGLRGLQLPGREHTYTDNEGYEEQLFDHA